MSNYDIGISGLSAAQRALDVIGNNLANASTEGYHRQRIELTPGYSLQIGSLSFGQGVDVIGLTRMVDNLLEQEILRQQSSLACISQESTTLRTVETAFGELTTGNSLNATIDEFFNALQDLSAHPGETIWQNQAVTTAEAMAGRFRTLGEFLTTLEDRIKLEAENIIEQINTLTNQIAELNDKIEKTEIGGAQANNLRDKRDQHITELSKFIGVETLSREYGVVDVASGGIPLVTGTSAVELEVGFNENNEMGITIAGAYSYSTNVQGGQLGGLLSLKNELIFDVHNGLDDLASAIIQQINQYHVQGVGSSGSFTELTGWIMTSEDFADFEPPITSGSVFIRVTDTTVPGTTTITRHEIDIANDLPADPTLSDFADYITNNITGLTASVVSSKLKISADANYEFDFLPAVLAEPESGDINFNGSSDPTVSVSGIYEGSSNDTFTFTVSGTGNVGVDSLTLTVTDGDSNTIDTINIGSGYAAGEKIDVGDTGIKISLSIGDLVDGDSFSIDVFADTDTSGLLAAVGINTFFSGSGASNMAVCSDIAAAPGRVAASLGADMTDNANALRLADLRDQAVSSLGAMTPGEFYRQLVTNVGQQLHIKQMRQDNIEAIVQNLLNQQSEISGVNINDEAARLLVFEQMFQAMAKYITTIQSTVSSIMEMI